MINESYMIIWLLGRFQCIYKLQKPFLIYSQYMRSSRKDEQAHKLVCMSYFPINHFPWGIFHALFPISHFARVIVHKCCPSCTQDLKRMHHNKKICNGLSHTGNECIKYERMWQSVWTSVNWTLFTDIFNVDVNCYDSLVHLEKLNNGLSCVK